jgi:hypothetical protein
MFRQFATVIPPQQLMELHPVTLAGFLERVWAQRAITGDPLGHPDNRSNVDQLPEYLLDPVPGPIFDRGEIAPPFRWDHLIYAYMVENTRIVEIFRRVVSELVHGEKLGTPLPGAQRWLRTTEELFFRDVAPFAITSVQSHLRPDQGGNRRHAYHRMFDMELNHGGEDGKPYPYRKADAANKDFVGTFEELLREVWIGMTHVAATSSSNPTDPSKIADLATKLHDMLRSRRQHGNLSREEFAAVAALSWFHLAVESDSPIITSLRADATGTEQRLFKVAERVGLPAHGLSKHFFGIADPMSRILIQIEMGDFNSTAAVPALYTPASPGAGSPEEAMRQIIMHWTHITGRDVKARKVAAV